MAAKDDASAGTLGHYSRNADDFRAGTWGHDVSQNIGALLDALSMRPGAAGAGPFSILDFGCGPGRDLLAWSRLGHEAVGLDGAGEFVRMAREASGCEVLHQDFLALDLPPQRFDGIFANASLFHVPSAELPRVLAQLRAALKEGGILFSSNPRGEDVEGWSGERYGVWHSLAGWRSYLVAAGFMELRHYYRPDGLPREQQPWLASVWRKI
ncbi:class I SAM-dependent methyltransferase [Herbaspirillum sp. WKF16]|jgi:SAM-dependent methyltransferase|uniref:class I SAM-dependent methyltransferase n=1 Tax=Herbaspirillum sp. WKF16 TaxID=3028312 RepID=UPI0023A9D0EC|nr:class I SAM-dependent methyltransferase [Herbaspirillum sp. WKF16]WDZ98075.1 class I SAM-dependent methyltransferase [Herbaspirillum sp. WKF16]